jgi:hypothetical protein
MRFFTKNFWNANLIDKTYSNVKINNKFEFFDLKLTRNDQHIILFQKKIFFETKNTYFNKKW